MKSFKELMLENSGIEYEEVVEGKEKKIKVVMDSKGKPKKVKTFSCTGENQKYNPSTKKCVSVSGAEKAKKKKGAKKRQKTMNKIPDSVKAKKAKKMEKARARFGL